MKTPKEMFAAVLASLMALPRETRLRLQGHAQGTKHGYRKEPHRSGAFGRLGDRRLTGRDTSPDCRKAARRGGKANPYWDGY